MVPDFRLRLPTPEGLADHLAELKFVSAGVTWFPRGVRGKGTDKRALQRLDSRYHHTAAHQNGPLVRRLQSFGKLEGLVVGPWGRAARNCTAWPRPLLM